MYVDVGPLQEWYVSFRGVADLTSNLTLRMLEALMQPGQIEALLVFCAGACPQVGCNQGVREWETQAVLKLVFEKRARQIISPGTVRPVFSILPIVPG